MDYSEKIFNLSRSAFPDILLETCWYQSMYACENFRKKIKQTWKK